MNATNDGAMETPACPVCDLVSLLYTRNVMVYLYSSLAFVPRRVIEGLAASGYSPQERGMYLEIEAERFSDVIEALGRSCGLTDPEKGATVVCFTERGRPFGLDSLAHVKPLSQWEDILGAGDLLDVLRNGRIVTHFQPIVDYAAKSVYACECLSRGVRSDGERINPAELFGKAKKAGLIFNLDKLCRQSAIVSGASLCGSGRLFINFIPTAIYNPEHCLQTTTALVEEYGEAPEKIVFEVVESESVTDLRHLQGILDYYRERGFRTALDDVGSGYSSLNRLIGLRPDYVKLDIGLVRDIHKEPMKQHVFEAIETICRRSGIEMLAEGIEHAEEVAFFHNAGVRLMQGYFFAKPAEVPQPVSFDDRPSSS